MPLCALVSRLLLIEVVFCSCISFSQSGPASSPEPNVPPQKAAAGTTQQGSPVQTPNLATSDTDKQGVVVEHNSVKVRFEADGTGVREVSYVVRVQSQAGVQALGILKFAYLSSNESVDFEYVRVHKPDGTVVNTPDYNIQDMPAEVTRIAPMYSDIHEKHVTVKALGVGDTLEYLVRFRTLKPQVPGQFWWDYSFTKDLIVRESELQITVPRDKYVNLISPEDKPRVKDEGANRTYYWKTSNLQLRDPELPVSHEAQRPDVQLSTFRSWDEVGRWYDELQRSQLTVTPQLQARVAEITRNLGTEDEKLRAIYNYVSNRYHYVSLSFGVGRYQPHPAQDVFENEYGDCKDKHTLLATMLKAGGIEAWPALINASRKLDPDMPSPGQFNHVITYVPRNPAALWLDTTPEVAPMGLLLADLRNKQALVIPNGKPADLKITPANPPFLANQTFTIEGTLDADGTLKGHVTQTLRGDHEVFLRLVFRAADPAKWKDVVQSISNNQGFGGDVSNVNVSSPEDTAKPFEFSYDYTRKNYGDWENRRIAAPLPLTGLEGASIQKKPGDPVVLGALGELIYKANINLPFDVVKLPADVSLSEPYAEYTSKTSHVGSALVASRVLKIKQNEVPLRMWDSYKSFSKALGDDWGPSVQLYAAAGTTAKEADEKSSASKTGEGTVGELDEKAQQAWAALQRNDTNTAEELTQELLKKYPNERGLHATMGYIYARRNQIDAAIDEFLKEEKQHPDNVVIYQEVAAYYVFLHREEEASEQYRKWIQYDPKNYDAYAGLSAILLRQKKYPEMLDLWEAAIKEMPDNIHVKGALGYAYLHNKQTGKAIALIEQGLTPESKPMDFNKASYELADADVELAKAMEWGEKALAGLYQESLKTTSEEEALRNTSFIAMTWDTVGWVYFQMGQYDKAELYLKSAFALSQGSLIGDHLAKTYEKQGKKRQAAQTYRLAYAAANYGPNAKYISEHFRQLMGPNAAIGQVSITRRPDGGWTPSPAEELSRSRTIKISNTVHQSSNATFSIIFSPGKIDDVKLVSGEEKLKPMATQIANSKLHADFPDTTSARLTRRALLVCGSLGCDVTLLLPDTPYATQSIPISN